MKTRALVLVCMLCLGSPPMVRGGEAREYDVVDPELKVVRLDTDATESFLSVRVDPTGRIFVGGREKLFVYEPDGKGGYEPRRVLITFPKHTWIYDVEFRGDDLYLLTTTALYRVPEGVTRRVGLRVQKLIWGIPLGHVHQCFHGLAWGPEGDLYLSWGDPLWYYGDFDRPDHWGYWTFHCQPDGTKVPYNGVGGVLRCKPDGSGLQVTATGLRNPCGLAFDADWNLFSNDNDHESLPGAYVPGRLLHMSPHAYFSWPRGWMTHKTPERADLLRTMFDGMGRAVPVGQSYYDDRYLPTKYHGNLLVARWGTRTLAAYPVEKRGASFRAKGEVPLLVGKNNARPVGVTVGRGGRIFATICYMAHNEASPIYRSDLVMITRRDDDKTDFAPLDLTKAPLEMLWKELSHVDWSRRMRAHQEMTRRGGPILLEANKRVATTKASDPAYPHILWLSAASGRGNLELTARIADGGARVRLHAVRSLGEHPEQLRNVPILTKRLDDPDAQVRLAALLAHFHPKTHCGDAALGLALRHAGKSEDTYLRQAAALLWAKRAELRRIVELGDDEDAKVRLFGVLAAGFRLTIPPIHRELPDTLPLTPHRTKEATLIEYKDGPLDLTQWSRIGNYTFAEHWQVEKHTEEQEALFAFLKARLRDKEEPIRLQAAHFLSLLNDARSEPIIAKVRAARVEKQLGTAPLEAIKPLWVVGPFDDGGKGLETIHPPERGPVDLSATYTVGAEKRIWKKVNPDYRYDLGKLLGSQERASYYAYTRLESANRQSIHLLVGSDDGLRVWHNGKEIWTWKGVRGALPFQDVVTLDLTPGSNDILARVNNVNGDSALYMHFRARGGVKATLPDALDSALLAERLKAAGKDAAVPAEFLTVDWSKESLRGDAEKGRKLFETLACAKCHGVRPDAGTLGGPSLGDARKRFTVSYLVESILLPSKQISPVFQTTQIETRAGKIVTGLVLQENGDEIVLLQMDATRLTLPRKEIESRRIVPQSSMPAGLVRTVEELRDLLAYLLAE